MQAFCCVVNCGSRASRDNVKFYRIRAKLNFKHKVELNNLSQLRRQKRLNSIKRADLTENKLKYAVVCSKHFISGKPAELNDSLNPDWIPSLNMGYGGSSELAMSSKMERYNRKRSRTEVCSASSSLSPSADKTNAEVGEADVDMLNVDESNCDKATQTKITTEDLTHLFLQVKKNEEKEKTMQKTVICMETMINDDIKTKYYTSLSTYSTFMVLVEIIKPLIKTTPWTTVSAELQILLTLMKLRLNLDFTDLAYRFGVSKTTASTYFKNTVAVMSISLRNFIFWPDRNIIKKTMPSCFKNSFQDKTTIIIDCFEVRMETPSSMLTAAQC